MKGHILIVFIILFSLSSAFGQIKITGSVKDAKGETLIGANIGVVGTTIGTIADINGNFTIEVPAKDDELVISFIGYASQKMKIGNQTSFQIILNEDALKLDDVVVLGYGRVSKSNVIGAISSIKAEDIESRPVANVSQALQGKVAGVSITNNSGAPGEGSSLRIRGIGTVNNSEPLYVIDGVIAGGMGHVNPADVESIEILKDAADAAIYGAKGANGVVIINTKKGAQGKLSINADYYHGTEVFNNNVEVMDRYDWYIHNEIAQDRFTNANSAIKQGREDFLNDFPSANWVDEISRPGQLDKVSISLSQGTEKMSFYASLGFRNHEGVIINSGYNQTNLNLNSTVKPNNKLTLNFKAAYSGSKQQKQESGKGSIFRQALMASPIDIYDPIDGFMLDNPLKKASLRHNISETQRTDLNLNLNYDIIKGLSFESRIQYYYNTNYNEAYEYVNPQYEYEFYSIDDYKKPVITNELINSNTFSWDNILTFNKKSNGHDINAMLICTVDQTNKINVKTKGESYLYNNVNFAYSDLATYKLETSGVYNDSRGIGFAGRLTYGYKNKYLSTVNFRYDGSSIFPENSRWGFFPSIQLGWRISEENFMQGNTWIDQLKIRASAGQSGNNRIDKNDQYTIYNNGDAYYSYGTTQQNVIIDGYIANNLGNHDILWEKTTTYNVGLDFGLFNALYGSVEYFEKYTSDMLIAVPIVDAAGLTSAPIQNAGDVKNTGVEFELSYTKKIGQFEIGANANIAFLKNKVTSLGNGGAPIYGGNVDNPDLGYVTYTSEGNSIGEFYGYVYDDDDMFYRTAEEVLANDILISGRNLTYGDPYIGSFKFKDLNGDGRLDDQDKTFLGSPIPKYSGGFGMNVKYKQVKIDMFWQYQVGNKIFNVMRYYLDAGAVGNNDSGNATTLSNKRASNIGEYIYTYNGSHEGADIDTYNSKDNQATATLPSLSNNSNVMRQFVNRPSNFFIEDGSYMRLKDLRVTYELKPEQLKKLKLKTLGFYVSATNLYTFSKYSGFDPEIGTTSGESSANINMGIDFGTYPAAQTFSFGVNIGL